MKRNYVYYIAIAAIILFIMGRYLWAKPKFIHGEIAPDFTAELSLGESFRLNDLRGQYVLLDFWGSWCGPCRQANPGVLKIYNKYHNATFSDAKGLEVVSIAIEKSAERWQNAIASDGLNWKYHVCDMQYFDSPLAKAYGVREIPTTYLINGEGYIVGVNLPHEQIEKFLDARLK